MSEFKVKFRGVRGSYPVVDKDFMRYGGNTSCVEVNVGGHLIIIDAGTGMINVGDELMQDYIISGTTNEDRTPIKALVLLSHIHHDHIQGFTFFRPLHIRSTVVDVYGNVNYNESLADELATLLFGKSFPLDLGDIAGNLNIHDISETDAIILKPNKNPIIRRIETSRDLEVEEDDVLITFYRSYAHPQEGVLIYKIQYKGKTLVYASDKETYHGGDRKLASFAKDCDLIIHDSQYTTEDYMDAFVPKQGYGHSTFDMSVECKEQINAKQLVFFHFDPSYNDEKLDKLKEEYQTKNNDAILAYEGLEINLL
ncbi:MBL fold metallo-hydrolase [bacterium]|nr:MBL fold metallo-hydrolase [bacterium]